MKKVVCCAFLIAMLTGCGREDAELNRAMALRTRLLNAGGVTFQADIAADYGDKLHLFSMNCRTDPKGAMSFTVTAPDTLTGITGTIAEGKGQLTFDDVALHFGLLTDRQLNPVSAPWILMQTLRSGYLTSAGMEGQLLRLTIHDSYEEDSLQLDIWLNEQDLPQCAEILCDGKGILSLTIKEFQIV